MSRPQHSLRFILALSLLAACGDDDAATDAGDMPDAGDMADTEGVDVGPADAAVDANPQDVGTEPATFPRSPFPGLTADEIARGAAIIGSCLPDDGARGPLRDAFFDLSPDSFWDEAQLRCLAAADDGCAATARCLGIDFDLMGPCTASCEGNTLVVCDDEWRFQIDCGTDTCDVEERECVAPVATACGGDGQMCVAGTPTTCIDSVERQGFSCADYGLACSDSDGLVGCAGSGAACEWDTFSTYGVDASGVSCTSDDELLACVNGAEHTIRCADIHSALSCQTNGALAYCGLGAECDPFARDTATCDGTSLVLCVMGQSTTLDCTAMGFETCAVGGRDGAHCAPSSWLP